MKKKLLFFFALLCMVAQGAWSEKVVDLSQIPRFTEYVAQDDENGPQRPVAVLQHGQQRADEDGRQHHAVVGDEQPVDHRAGVVRVCVEQYPPDVGHGHDAE